MKQQPYRKPLIPRRNEPCPCKSGKKAKRCCLDRIRTLAAIPRHLREQFLVAQILAPPIVVAPLVDSVTVEEVVAEVAEEATARTDARIAKTLSH